MKAGMGVLCGEEDDGDMVVRMVDYVVVMGE